MNRGKVRKMKRILLLGMAIVAMAVSLQGCFWWGWDGPGGHGGRGGRGGGWHDGGGRGGEHGDRR